ncbi:hypothetical protein C8F01DRAFT_382977 [Mycena amicta]|nr:hypothetical protein C8F01DRAFT_382977 [Mycena amicta]
MSSSLSSSSLPLSTTTFSISTDAGTTTASSTSWLYTIDSSTNWAVSTTVIETTSDGIPTLPPTLSSIPSSHHETTATHRTTPSESQSLSFSASATQASFSAGEPISLSTESSGPTSGASSASRVKTTVIVGAAVGGIILILMGTLSFIVFQRRMLRRRAVWRMGEEF